MGNIGNDTVRLRVVGCGDAFGSGGRFNTCFAVEDPHGRFLIDCGTTSLTALQAAGIDPADIDLVVLSHLHGDHFGGLPFLLLHRQFAASARNPLVIAGPPGFAARLRALFESMYPGLWKQNWAFDLDLVDIAPGQPAQLGARRLLTTIVRHHAGPEPCTGLRVTTSARTIAYSGDTGWTDALIELADQSNLFLCECNDLHDQSYEGHMSYQTLLGQHHRLNTRRLLLTHLGNQMLSAAAGLELECAYDGLQIEL